MIARKAVLLHYYFKMHKIPLASLNLIIEIERIERTSKTTGVQSY